MNGDLGHDSALHGYTGLETTWDQVHKVDILSATDYWRKSHAFAKNISSFA